MQRGIKVLAVATTVVMFLVLLAGALVTNTGSADGCGASWPLCKGTFMPEWDYEAIIEFGHRGISTLAGLLALTLAVVVWRKVPDRPLVRWLAVGGLGFTVFQGLLGAAAVLWPQPKAVLALHFGISLICFCLVFLTASQLLGGASGSGPASPQLARWTWTVAIFGYGVVYLGAYVRHMKASMACAGWPLCNGELLPPLSGQVGAAFAHRIGAALLVVMVVRLALMVYREAPELRRAATFALVLVGLQVISGALMPLGWFNLITQLLHSAVITLFWGSLSFLCLQVLPAVRRPGASLLTSVNGQA